MLQRKLLAYVRIEAMNDTETFHNSRCIVPQIVRTLLLATLLLILVACGSTTSATPALGQPAPDFTMSTLAGPSIRLADLKGRVVIVNFWATWCPPCENETPRLVAWYEQYHGAGLEVLGVDKLVQDSRDAVADFVAKYAVSYPVPLDQTGDISRQWQALQLPRSYVIDREGIVRYVRIGELTQRDFDEQVLPLLQAGG